MATCKSKPRTPLGLLPQQHRCRAQPSRCLLVVRPVVGSRGEMQGAPADTHS